MYDTVFLQNADLLTVEEVLTSAGLRSALPPCRCKNGAKCRQRVQIQPDTQIKVLTNSTVFIAPAYSFTFYCSCALGYSGLERSIPILLYEHLNKHEYYKMMSNMSIFIQQTTLN